MVKIHDLTLSKGGASEKGRLARWLNATRSLCYLEG